MAFPPEFLDEIRRRVGLADVIGKRTKLTRKGREHLGLCPFHKEKTPSFTVNEDKGFYHCFGCGAHGDVIGFVMQTEGLSFPETVEKLAAEGGLQVPRSSPEDRAREQRRAGLFEVLEMACLWFQEQLAAPVGEEARRYLHDRAVIPDAVRGFRLGFAPGKRGGLRQAMNAKGVNDTLLAEAGLIKLPDPDDPEARGRDPRAYFFNRLIFPITDRRGQVIAFGGRALGDAQPKYLNSPDTPLFHKGRVLYNLARARQAARDTGEIIVAEGYMDVIALSQAGFPAAVAPLGTALTEDQILELWKLRREPVICLDGDQAGRRAAFRAIDRALPVLKAGHSLQFALLPEGEDPDTLVRQRGASAMRQVLDQSRPMIDLLWLREAEGRPLDTPERRIGLLKDLQAAVGQIRDPDLKRAYRSEIGNRFQEAFGRKPQGRGGFGKRNQGRGGWRGGREGGGREFGGREFGGRDRQGARGRPRGGAFGGGEDLAWRQRPLWRESRPEQLLVATLINHPELLFEQAEDLAVLDLKTPVLQGLMRELIDCAATQSNLDTQGLRCHLSHKGYSKFLDTLLHQQVYQHGRFARPEAPLEEVRPQWGRYLADFRQRLVQKDLDQAVRELAEDPNEGNLVRLKANQSLSHRGAGREMDPDDSNRAGDLDRIGSDGSKRANGDGG